MSLHCNVIVGCDEVGYGSVAGPLVVCGVRAAAGWSLEGLNDSKKLSAKKRQIMRDKLQEQAYNGIIMFHIAERSNVVIDTIGLGKALKEAYIECFDKLDYYFDDNCQIIVDGILKFENLDYHQVKSIVKADTTIPTVMAASILAKTYRDEKMKILHNLHPHYNWKKNVGYGVKEHLNAIKEHGLSPLHRHSYNLKSINKSE